MISYWHNPRCSKSRMGLAYLTDQGAEVTLRLYLKDTPTLEELRTLRAALGTSTLAMMRPKDKAFKDLGLSKDTSEDALLAALLDHPALLERPIAVKGNRAVIGRPTDALAALL